MKCVKFDDSIWMRHVTIQICEYCEGFRHGEHFPLLINGEELYFEWMKPGRDGRLTPGIKATPSFRAAWNEIPKGAQVTIDIPE